MYLINSAAYVTQALRNEVGNIPPAFLPVKNQRLFVHQVRSFTFDEDVYLSIPNNYEIKEFDKVLLDSYKINIIRVPVGLTLGESVYYALQSIDIDNEVLRILHGDTLVLDLPENEGDFVIASSISDNYNWSSIENTTGNIVYSGYFSLNNIEIFNIFLKKSNYKFIQAIKEYSNNQDVSIVKTNSWLDFGHIHTYYRSKASMPNVRYFNSMEINTKVVKKLSKDNDKKIIAEYKWFQKIPLSLKYYTPQLVNIGDKTNSEIDFYELEYLYFLSLNEVFVYCDLPNYKWKQIFTSCKLFLKEASNYYPEITRGYINNDIYLPKTLSRLEEFFKENESLSTDLSYNGQKLGKLKYIAIESAKYIDIPSKEDITILHGDFCFSNLLFDFRRKDIKVIDPRGIDLKGNFDIYGDRRYDYAKLAHSIIGLYDYIIAERYFLNESNLDFNIHFPNITEIEKVQNLFWENFVQDTITKKYIYASIIQLFISMLPLHKDSRKRQKALLANSLRLFLKLKSL